MAGILPPDYIPAIPVYTCSLTNQQSKFRCTTEQVSQAYETASARKRSRKRLNEWQQWQEKNKVLPL
ncbi:MAG: hypothetical protein IJY59_08975 [Bacteroidaceae bacterium]|nr:hypothetical protein [Bacteroidaceae bacterium]